MTNILKKSRTTRPEPTTARHPAIETECWQQDKTKEELEIQLRACAEKLKQTDEALHAERAKRKQAEAALRDSELKFRAIAQSASDAIIAADGQGKITFWNKGAQNIFGYTETEMVGQPLTDLMPDRYKTAHQNGMKRFQSTGEAHIMGQKVEFEGRRKDDHEFPLELSLNTWMTGGDPFFSGIIHDITERKQAEKVMAEQDNLLRTLIDILPDYIYVKDANNGHVINNIAHVRIVQENKKNGSNGKQNFDAFSRDLAAQYYAHEQEVIRTGQPLLNKEETVMDPHGRKHWLLTTTVPLRDQQGEITALVGVSRDITEHKQAEEERDQLFTLSLDLLAVAGLDGYLKQVNPAWEKTLGYTKEELLAKPYIQLVHPEDREAVRAELQKLAAGHNAVSLEVRFLCADGTYRWISWNGTPFVTDRLLFGIGRDVTKRKQIEEEKARLLEAVNRQRTELHALAGRLAEVQETERQQLGRELHDQIGQNLSALGFNLNFIRTQMPETAPKAALIEARLTDSLALVEQTTERFRDVLAELHPPVLDDYGLVDALEWYTERFAARVGLIVKLQGEAPNPRLSPPIENTLFRIAQEALTNIAKHAQATRVLLSLGVDEQMVRLVVADDGIGFEAAHSNETRKRQGWGLRIMAERAERIGGRCWVETRPGQGVRVVVEVKRSNEDEASQ